MACGDKSMTFLRDLGYNVVRHPRKGIAPLELIGRQNGTVQRLGSIDQLVQSSESPLPRLFADEIASSVNGQASSGLTLGIGVNILGSIISAMGGNLGINVSYTNARKITFVYTDVLSDRVQPLDVGNYLRDGDVDAGNLILKEYVLGNGELFLLTETVKASKFSVKYETKDGAEAKVDVPAIQALAGANISVKLEGSSSSTVSFEGPDRLTFGFKCLRVGVKDGILRLLSSKPGETGLEAIPPAVAEPAGELLGEIGFLEVRG